MNCWSIKKVWGSCGMKSFSGIAMLTLGMLTSAALAQNPVPQVVGPPSPQAVKPGGGDFKLKVYGANFMLGSVVNWNRQPRATSYVSGHEVDATILASDLVSNTVGYITVTNPPPGGGNSSSSYGLVEVHPPTATIFPGKPHHNSLLGGYTSLVGDVNGDGILDLAGGAIEIALGNGDGTFRYGPFAAFVAYGGVAAYGDFNGDGNLDIVFTEGTGRFVIPTHLCVNFGNGDGTFHPGPCVGTFVDPKGQITVYPAQIVAGDFNRDGKLDMALAGGSSGPGMPVYMGKGDGSFQHARNFGPGRFVFAIWAGDFNGDGKLDLLGEATQAGGAVTGIYLLIGNGDGTFQKARQVATSTNPCNGCGAPMQVSDFNNDGILDLAYGTSDAHIAVLLGNGDGTFQKPVLYSSGLGKEFTNFVAGDFNSDGNIDFLSVGNNSVGVPSSTILLGNGDGTYNAPKKVVLPSSFSPYSFIVGDFNNDGLLDFVNNGDAFIQE
jgi:hypothetical protein